MKTVYQVSQKFNTEKETQELSAQEFDNYQDAKDNFEEIKSNGLIYQSNEIPTQKLHLLEVIKHKIDKKTWWKFWKN